VDRRSERPSQATVFVDLEFRADGGSEFALGNPFGAWAAPYLWSFVAVLSVGCAIPHRPGVPAPTPVIMPSLRSPAHEGADRCRCYCGSSG
jgi:hypothetical protein